jgi:serine/threonine protein kinase
LPEQLIRKYFSDVVSCLEYLKTKGTCHGDIKANTILINPNGRAFLADSYFIHGGKISYEIVMEDPSSLSLLSPSHL